MVFPYVQKGSLEPRDPFSYEDDDRPTFKSASSFMLYALSVAQAVQQCHQVGVAHMDLKLSNIMPKDDGSGVWLIDFGVARVLEEGQDTCVFHTRTGSPFYIAPEFDNFKGAEAALLNPKACDVYSLGKVFVALLGGDIRAKELVWPEGFEGLYPACVKLIEKMLSSNPLERPSIEDVVGVLETLKAVS
jgi:serine/threonine protein kinase